MCARVRPVELIGTQNAAPDAPNLIPCGRLVRNACPWRQVPAILSQATSARIYIHEQLSLPPATALLSDLLSRLMLASDRHGFLLGEKALALLLDFFFSYACSIGMYLYMCI